MIAKLSSPLGSPTLAATTAQLRNRLPVQFRRCLPLYLSALAVVILIFNFHLFHNVTATSHQVPPELVTTINNVPKPRNAFPNKIWQTWKVSPLAFEQRDLDVARSWTRKNRDWRYEVLTDSNSQRYVEWHFGPDGFNRPDIVRFYSDLKAAIVKADLLRYLVMYAEGGVYADIDVEALRPLTKFIPERYDQRDIDMVVGVEIDEPDWKDHPILGPKSRSFCQWTFMCKPQLPVMMRLVEQIMTWLNGVAAEQGVPIADVKLDFDQIISGTGPSAFTNAIMAEMEVHNPTPERKITWDMFHDLGESKVVSRVLVLTVEAFAAGQGHSDSGNHDARAALVRHHYHASNWPSRHPRYSHPAYGEVEQCNWNDECVHKWDKNVAEFEKMSEDEQKRIVEEKEREKKAEEDKRKAEEDKRKKEKEAADKKKKEEAEAERKKKEEEDRIARENKETSVGGAAAPEHQNDNTAKAAAKDGDKKPGDDKKAGDVNRAA